MGIGRLYICSCWQLHGGVSVHLITDAFSKSTTTRNACDALFTEIARTVGTSGLVRGEDLVRIHWQIFPDPPSGQVGEIS